MNFEEYYITTNLDENTVPDVLKLAFRDLVMKAWNAALDTSISVVNTESNQNRAMDKIAEFKVND